MQVLSFTAVDVVDTEEGTGKGSSLAEGYKERFMDLALWVNKDPAEEEYETSNTKHKGSD